MLEKAIVKHLLPVHFCLNTKRWVTGLLVMLWTTRCQNLKMNCENTVLKKIWPFNILLIVSNALGHPTLIQELGEHIKVVFIPPNFNISNTTSG
jgi:hypothetical protein